MEKIRKRKRSKEQKTSKGRSSKESEGSGRYAKKIIFVGNTLGGDDGIGPFLYQELKDNNIFKSDDSFKDWELIDLNVDSLSLVSFLEDCSEAIIVDAVHVEPRERHYANVGDIIELKESQFASSASLLSQHDLGIEQIIPLIRSYNPEFKITILGINVKKVTAFKMELSTELKNKLPEIKENLIRKLTKLIKAE